MKALKLKSPYDVANKKSGKGLNRKTKRTLFIIGMLAIPLL